MNLVLKLVISRGYTVDYPSRYDVNKFSIRDSNGVIGLIYYDKSGIHLVRYLISNHATYFTSNSILDVEKYLEIIESSKKNNMGNVKLVISGGHSVTLSGKPFVSTNRMTVFESEKRGFNDNILRNIYLNRILLERISEFNNLMTNWGSYEYDEIDS